jgi:[protein-PII] uridylyltransferase
MQIPLLDLKQYYWQNWERIKTTSLNLSPWDVVGELANLVDRVLIELTKNEQDNLKKISIIALGGYARKQFFPYSDIDLLIIYKDKLNKEERDFIKHITTAIWDLNITLGFQLKKIDEIFDLSKEDEIFKTALLDNRFIIGNDKLYNDFVEILEKKIFGRNKVDYLIFKVKNVRNRTKKISNSIYLLEPNLKDTPGGLRDINTIYWICKLLFNSTNLSIFIFKNVLKEKDLLSLVRSIEFIFKIRIQLHYYHKRKYDVLSMEAQKYLANLFGYIDTSLSLGVELFMKDYYKAANIVQQKVNKIINLSLQKIFKHSDVNPSNFHYLGFGFYKYNNCITFKDNDFFIKNPNNLILIFYLAAYRNLKITDIEKDIIRENTYLIDNKYIREHANLFMKTLASFPYSSVIARNMVETGVLQKFIPEFEDILCRPQFDYYHHYTIDEHTLLALKNIDSLVTINDSKTMPFIKSFQELKRKEILAMSILLHDIGKGRGKNHSLIGSKIAEKICNRLGINSGCTRVISKMVEHHLLMNHIAQRRDIKDIDVLKYFNKYINTLEELNVLFLLTYADINAVGGFTYSNWVNALLVEFYENAKNSIVKKNIIFNKKFIVKEKLNTLLQYFNKDDKIQELIKLLDEEYIYANDVQTIISHLKLLNDISINNVVKILIKVRNDINCLDVTICTYDYIGLLRNITAAFLSFNLNILNAEVNTLGNGMTVDNFLVEKSNIPIDEIIPSIKNIRETVKNLITGNIDPYNLLKEKLSERFEKKRITNVKNIIDFDNNLSETYTIIDIYTTDKVGLLFKLLDKFCKLNISVQKAKISTDVDRVVDSFYVVDEMGQKITNDEKIKNIKKLLEDTLNE